MSTIPLVIVSALLLLFGAGLPLAGWSSETDKRWRWCIAPTLGFAVISALTHTLGWMGIGVNRFALPLAVACGAGAMWSVQRERPHGPARRDLLILGSLVAVGLAVAVLPLIRLGYSTTLGTTVDAVSAVSRAEVVLGQGLEAPLMPEARPFYEWAAAPLLAGIRMGDAYLLSLVSQFASVRAYEAFTTTAAVLLVLTSLGVFAFARFRLETSSSTALLAAALTVASPLLAWAVYDNFLSQVCGTFLLPATLALLHRALDHGRAGDIVLAGVSFGGLVSAYPTYAVFATGILASMALVCILHPAPGTRRFPLPAVGLRGTGIIALAAASNPIALERAVREVKVIAAEAASAGNMRHFGSLTEVFGLASHPLATLPAADVPPHLAINAALVVLVMLMVILVLGWSWLPSSRAKSLACGLVIPTVLFGIEQRFGLVRGIASPYAFFKTLALLFLVFVPLLSNGLTRPWNQDTAGGKTVRSTAWKALAGVAILGLLAINALAYHHTIAIVLSDRVVVDHDVLSAVEAVAELPGNPGIVIDTEPGLLAYWLGYLMNDRDLHFLSPGGIYHHRAAGGIGFPTSYALVDLTSSQATQPQGPLEARRWSGPGVTTVWSNSRFEIRREGAPEVSLELPPRRACTGDSAPVSFVWSPNEVELLVGTEQALGMAPWSATRALQMTATWSGEVPLHLELPNFGTVQIEPGTSDIFLPLGRPAGQLAFAEEVPGALCVAQLRFGSFETPTPQVSVVRRPGIRVATTQRLDGPVVTLEQQIDLFEFPAEHPPLRFGLHVAPADSRIPPFGVWSIDLDLHLARQNLRLQVDLTTKRAVAWLNGQPYEPAVAAIGSDDGTFSATIALWDLSSTAAPFQMDPGFTFTRNGSSVTVSDLEGHLQADRAWQ